MIYKLSYTIAIDPNNQQEVLVEDEIELAKALLNMERDVGKICYNVQINKISRPENFRYANNKAQTLKEIQHYAKILETDLKKK